MIINNAGRGITRNPSELTDEDIDDMMAINVKSAIYGMQASVAHASMCSIQHVTAALLVVVPRKRDVLTVVV